MTLTAEELLKQAQKLNEEEKSDEVIALLEDELLEKYQNAYLFAEKAQAYCNLKNFDKAIDFCKKGNQLDYNCKAIYNVFGDIYYYKKDYETAIENYENAIRIEKLYPDPYNGIGNVYIDQEKYLKAIEYYLLAKDYGINPKYAIHGLGVAYMKLGNYTKSIEYFNQLLQITPNNKYLFNELGNYYLDLKEYEQGKRYYESALRIDPRFGAAYNGLGNIYLNLNKLDEAEFHFLKAVNLEPDNAKFHNGLGNVYISKNKINKAIEEYEKAISFEVNLKFAYNGLGNAYYGLRNYEKAQENYFKAIGFDKRFSHPFNGLGNINSDNSNFEKAIENFTQAINLEDSNEVYYFNRALAYNKLNKYSEAIIDFQKFVDLTKDNPSHFTALANTQIIELKKKLSNEEYNEIGELVKEIKNQLLYKGDCITHYTSISTTKALILNDSGFRISEGTYLNDTSEGSALLLFLEALDNQNNRSNENYNFSYSSEVDDRSNEAFDYPFAPKPFVGSFTSEINHNQLNLWRLYGKENKEDAKGCSITINCKEFIQNIKEKVITKDNKRKETSINATDDFSFYSVAYIKKGMMENETIFSIYGFAQEQIDLLNETITKLKAVVIRYLKEYNSKNDKLNLLIKLNEITYLFKRDSYNYEHEVRLVVSGNEFDKCIGINGTTPNVYIELVPISPILKRITIGPKVERAEEWATAFYYKLAESYLKPEIVISKLPFK